MVALALSSYRINSARTPKREEAKGLASVPRSWDTRSAMSDDYDDDGGREERDVRRSSVRKDILWWFVLVLFIGVTVGLIQTVFIAGVVVGAVGLSWAVWDEWRGGRRARKQS